MSNVNTLYRSYVPGIYHAVWCVQVVIINLYEAARRFKNGDFFLPFPLRNALTLLLFEPFFSFV